LGYPGSGRARQSNHRRNPPDTSANILESHHENVKKVKSQQPQRSERKRVSYTVISDESWRLASGQDVGVNVVSPTSGSKAVIARSSKGEEFGRDVESSKGNGFRRMKEMRIENAASRQR
jgi:hypothetical protein